MRAGRLGGARARAPERHDQHVALERELEQIPGVVCTGLFARRRADVVIVGGEPPIVL